MVGLCIDSKCKPTYTNQLWHNPANQSVTFTELGAQVWKSSCTYARKDPASFVKTHAKNS